MQVTVSFPADQVERWVADVFHKQLPFVNATAVNTVALKAQTVQRTHMMRAFKVRRPDFVNSAVKLKPRATKQKPEARLLVEPLGGQKRASVIGQHESESRKESIKGGGRSIAVPTTVQMQRTGGVIRRAERPHRLLKSRSRDVFVRENPNGGGTIFERLPGGRLRALYQLVSSVPLDRRLGFVDNITKSVLAEWPGAFVAAFDRAIRTAR